MGKQPLAHGPNNQQLLQDLDQFSTSSTDCCVLGTNPQVAMEGRTVLSSNENDHSNWPSARCAKNCVTPLNCAGEDGGARTSNISTAKTTKESRSTAGDRWKRDETGTCNQNEANALYSLPPLSSHPRCGLSFRRQERKKVSFQDFSRDTATLPNHLVTSTTPCLRKRLNGSDFENGKRRKIWEQDSLHSNPGDGKIKTKFEQTSRQLSAKELAVGTSNWNDDILPRSNLRRTTFQRAHSCSSLPNPHFGSKQSRMINEETMTQFRDSDYLCDSDDSTACSALSNGSRKSLLTLLKTMRCGVETQAISPRSRGECMRHLALPRSDDAIALHLDAKLPPQITSSDISARVSSNNACKGLHPHHLETLDSSTTAQQCLQNLLPNKVGSALTESPLSNDKVNGVAAKRSINQATSELSTEDPFSQQNEAASNVDSSCVSSMTIPMKITLEQSTNGACTARVHPAEVKIRIRTRPKRPPPVIVDDLSFLPDTLTGEGHMDDDFNDTEELYESIRLIQDWTVLVLLVVMIVCW